jgi:23S rRNA (pseudouridine1915-N3)-methyltransferase
MRLLIAAVGKLKQGPERELCAHYLARAEALGRSQGLSPLSTVELSEAKAADAKSRRAAEADALLAKVPPNHTLICLDPGGKMLSSEALAGLLGKAKDEGAAGLAFLIGGPDGLGEAVQERAELALSLGPLTLPHGLARIVLAEQIYRATTILAGHPYHRGLGYGQG